MKKKVNGLEIYTDGASRGNPGDAAWAYLILNKDGEVITNQSGYIGRSTNNQAEYFATIRALQMAREFTEGRVDVWSDSQLLVNQVSGSWKVKDEELQRLHNRVINLIDEFDEVTFTHVSRENSHISKADDLCNSRLDEVQNS